MSDGEATRAAEVGPGGRGAGAPRPPSGGAGQGVDRRGDQRVSDLEAIVQRAAQAVRLMKGEIFTERSVSMLARLVWLEFPKLPRWQIEELCGPPIVMGRVIDEVEILDRARQIAIVVDAENAA